MSVQTAEQIESMDKNLLIRYIIDTCEEYQIEWAAYGSLTRKKVTDLKEIAADILQTTQIIDQALELAKGFNSWEYDEPNKPGWVKTDEFENEGAIVEVLDSIDNEDFEDVVPVEAPAAKPKKVKKEKAPKAPKAPKEPRKRTFTDEQILEMISLVEEAKWKKSAVAAKFECSNTFVHNVIVGNVYRDVTGRGTAPVKKAKASEAPLLAPDA